MSARSSSSPLRTSLARLAVAGTAGLASVLTFAPVAVAAESAPSDTGSTEAPDTTVTMTSTDAPTDDPSPAPSDPAPSDPAPSDPAPSDPPPSDPAPGDPAPTPTDGPTDPTPGTGDPTPGTRVPAPAPAASSPKSAVKAKADVEPDFGYNKFRVGVKLADGSYVPSGTSTLGSTITIVETGPGVAGGSLTTTCTTTNGPTDPNGVSYCEDLTPGATPPFDSDSYFAVTGDTVTVTQTAATPNLTITDGVKTVVPDCDGGIQCVLNFGDVLLTDSPLPPTATDDHASTDEGVPVTIKVLHNDNRRDAPVQSVHVTNDANHGTTKVIGSGNSRRIRYTPDDGFTGIDHFTYDFTTPNGTATANVTVTVRAPAPAPEGVLPDTGGSDPRLLGLGLMLVAGGGAVVAVGRRPRRTDAIG